MIGDDAKSNAQKTHLTLLYPVTSRSLLHGHGPKRHLSCVVFNQKILAAVGTCPLGQNDCVHDRTDFEISPTMGAIHRLLSVRWFVSPAHQENVDSNRIDQTMAVMNGVS